MAYDLYLLPLQTGADIEEAGEALVARIRFGHESPSADAPAVRRRAELVAGLVAAAPQFALPVTDSAGATVLRGAEGLEVWVADRYLRFRVPFTLSGSAAAAAFDRLFTALAAAAAQTGWHLYDPQEAAGVSVDDAGRDETLELYQSVMDQLRP